MLTETRSIFLEAARSAVRLLEEPGVAERWDTPSVLVGYTVGGLTAHLGRAVSSPSGYLDQDEGGLGAVPTTDAADYFLEALGDHDPVDSDLHASVRQRSDDMAASGPLAVIDTIHAALQSLVGRLEVEPEDRVVVVFGGTSMRLDDYLETRIVELTIHTDDLLESCPDIGPAPLPEAAWALARRVIAEVAARRVGDRQFALGLSRQERTQRPLAF